MRLTGRFDPRNFAPPGIPSRLNAPVLTLFCPLSFLFPARSTAEVTSSIGACNVKNKKEMEKTLLRACSGFALVFFLKTSSAYVSPTYYY
ncbi:hypothetical protein ASPFODRAFT_49353 [Aspergillus luchuensis CBS 106.47]|uniref:Uncharacterized protein n=1 Tax=Aspergillus luchuensis (strain CBS 106.47) TaxID=1137211 RepID=A0A1M3TB20_ASPLC|nr:hypothetical protein ASPFODRAFT_49353 [Aspergillus luchuensis CBS 106.47]